MTVARAAALIVTLGLGLAPMASAGRNATPTTYRALKKVLPRASKARARALARFADDDTPALKERLKAARALTQATADTPPAQLAALLREARLQGLASSGKRRRGALRRALQVAERAKKKRRVAQIERALEADADLKKLDARLRARRKGAPRALEKDERALRSRVQKSVAVYDKLDDGPRAAGARLALLRLDASTGQKSGPLEKRGRALMRVGKSSRDYAQLREHAARLVATLLDRRGLRAEAAKVHFAADRARTNSLKRAASPSAARGDYRRSAATAAYCFEVKSKGVDCAILEAAAHGARTFHDYSRRKRRLTGPLAEQVLREYESALQACPADSDEVSALDHALRLDWTVARTGRVTSFTVEPRRFQSGEVYACLERAFAFMRYPRFSGGDREFGYELEIRHKTKVVVEER